MPQPAASAKLRPLQLAAVIFLTVSGGPYGLEPLLAQAGTSAALLLLLVTPILWDIPTILTVLELNSMMPVSGGYYKWVKTALGLRAGFYEGWWSWLYTFADLAIYPVLFVSYLAFFFPGIDAYKIPICLAIIWISAGINILGIVQVGRFSIVLSSAVLGAFGVLLGYTVWKYGSLTVPAQTLQGSSYTAIGLGLYTVMWNFIGWDNVTTYADEVRKPVRAYLLSIAIAFVAVIAIYAVALLIAMTAGMNGADLEKQGFPALGALVGGRWLGSVIAVGGLASMLGLYSAVLLSVSRIPKAMSDDGLLPARLHALHPKYGSPWLSVLCCSAVVSGMIFWDFGELLVIDITLYGAALLLEYVALIRFRIREPHRERPFRIPLGVPGLVVMAALPFVVYFVALSAAFMDEGGSLKPLLFALCTLASAEVVWQFIAWRRRAKGLG
ncbi:APC family permease [Flaviaesturariibacter amylovorans]|uniref:APC family permease n=1 Tax=Flaviaesturariibacter amylovorans TaxID=1084520 RepID=A0ABP8HGB2_9BACT